MERTKSQKKKKRVCVEVEHGESRDANRGNRRQVLTKQTVDRIWLCLCSRTHVGPPPPPPNCLCQLYCRFEFHVKAIIERISQSPQYVSKLELVKYGRIAAFFDLRRLAIVRRLCSEKQEVLTSTQGGGVLMAYLGRTIKMIIKMDPGQFGL